MEAEKDKAYYEKLDKRTKEYKDWVAKQKEQEEESLIGNKIEKFTEKTGIKKAVEKVAEAVGVDDCGCNTRKEKINDFQRRLRSMFIHKQPKLLTQDEYTWLVDYFKVNRTRVSGDDQRAVYKIYNRVFDSKKSPSSCPSCYKDAVSKLKKLIDLQRA